jgi:hypothetical protein
VVAALGGGIAIAANAPTPRQVTPPAPTAPTASVLVPITPVRVLDTRGAAGGPIGVPAAAKIGADSTIDVAVAGVGAIPENATGVAVNITIDEDATLKSFLTVWPAGLTRPNTSANNAEPGLVMSNSAIFQLGAGGKLSVYNQLGSVNVIMDVTGYFVGCSLEVTEAPTTTTPTTTATTEPTTTATAAGFSTAAAAVACAPTPTTTTTTVPKAVATDADTYVAGDPVTVTGTGWTGCTAIELTIDGVVAPVATGITPAADGTFEAAPFDAPAAGSHTLHANSVPAATGCTATTTFETT